jgi:hypothetical protein
MAWFRSLAVATSVLLAFAGLLTAVALADDAAITGTASTEQPRPATLRVLLVGASAGPSDDPVAAAFDEQIAAGKALARRSVDAIIPRLKERLGVSVTAVDPGQDADITLMIDFDMANILSDQGSPSDDRAFLPKVLSDEVARFAPRLVRMEFMPDGLIVTRTDGRPRVLVYVHMSPLLGLWSTDTAVDPDAADSPAVSSLDVWPLSLNRCEPDDPFSNKTTTNEARRYRPARLISALSSRSAVVRCVSTSLSQRLMTEGGTTKFSTSMYYWQAQLNFATQRAVIFAAMATIGELSQSVGITIHNTTERAGSLEEYVVQRAQHRLLVTELRRLRWLNDLPIELLHSGTILEGRFVDWTR